MDVSVALNGSRRRDLQFYAGDDTEIVLTVYQNDGDEDPIVVSDPVILYNDPRRRSLNPGDSFKACFRQRQRYSLVGYINSVRTTLAYGLLIRQWDDWSHEGGGEYQPLFVRNEVTGGSAGSYFEGPGYDGGHA